MANIKYNCGDHQDQRSSHNGSRSLQLHTPLNGRVDGLNVLNILLGGLNVVRWELVDDLLVLKFQIGKPINFPSKNLPL